MEYVFLVVGFALLTVSANWLVDGASGLAKRMNVPDLVIGLTVVAFGTSAPELVVNLAASWNGTSEIALTNILGSNAINTLVILGLSAVICPITCQKSTFRYEIPWSLLAGAFVLLMGTNLFGVCRSDFMGLSRIDGAILLTVFAVFLAYSFRKGLKEGREDATAGDSAVMKFWKAALLIVIGLTGLVFGGNLIVEKAVLIAEKWGVSESVIGATVVAFGTSLPELATSAVAAFKKNSDLAIGNVIGSNIFNVFLILGVSSLLSPLKGYPNLMVDASLAAGSSLLLLIFLSYSKKRRINRWEGTLMLLVYAVYLIWLLGGFV